MDYGVIEKNTGLADGRWNADEAKKVLFEQRRDHPLGNWELFEAPTHLIINTEANWGTIFPEDLDKRISEAKRDQLR